MKAATALDARTLPPVTDEYVIPWLELGPWFAPPGWRDGDGTILPEAIDWARANGVTIRQHWTGTAGLTPSDAHRARTVYEQSRAQQNAVAAAFQRHVLDQKRQAALARQEAQAKRDEEARMAGEKAKERQARRDAEEAFAAQAQAAAAPDYASFEKQYLAEHRGA